MRPNAIRSISVQHVAASMHAYEAETESVRRNGAKPVTNEEAEKAMTARMKVLAVVMAVATAALASFAAMAQQTAQNPRIALVIGNATYRDAALATTANDAGLIAQTLQAAGFDVVGARDLDGQSLRTAFRDFLDKALRGGSGHAGVRLSRRAGPPI